MPDFAASLTASATATLTNKTIDIINNTLALRMYAVIVTKVGSTYYAIKGDGTVLSSSTTCETVIQAALDNKGLVFLANSSPNANGNTSYAVSGSFTGFTMDKGTRLVGDYGSFIEVPQGQTGNVFLISSTTAGVAETTGIDRITINELGTAQRLWTGIKIQSDTASVDSCSYARFRNIVMYNPNVGIELEVQNSRWIESCTFEDILISAPVVGVLFDRQSGDIHDNLFKNVTMLTATGVTTHGFKDISNSSNVFINCSVWDIDATAIEANIKSDATGTIIIGGRMTGWGGGFIDQGTRTVVIGNMERTSALTTLVSPDVIKQGTWFGYNGTAASGLINGGVSAIVVGTGADAGSFDSTGKYRQYDTGATINSLAGIRNSVLWGRLEHNCYFKNAIYLNTNTNMRVFSGLVASTSDPASAADPLNGLAGIGLWLDTAVSANWKIMRNDSSGASVVTDTGVAAATATLYTVEIIGLANASDFRVVFNGTHTDFATDIPTATTSLGFRVYLENTTGASRTFRHYYLIVGNDK